jgi:hypothetical protein
MAQALAMPICLLALDRGDWCDELVALSRHRLDGAVQIAGIEVPAELTHQLLEAVVATAVSCHPARIRTSFDRTMFAWRTSRCRTSYSYGDNPTGSPPRVSDLLLESSR